MGRLRAPIMDQPRHIHDLADELLSEIVDLLDPPRVIYTKPNGKVHESINIFGEASDLDRFRLVCKRFMRIGTPHRFSRFTLRFSKHGFRRLDQLLEMQLACYVKSITYMVRPFYQGGGWPQIMQELETQRPTLFRAHSHRYREQTDLTLHNHDVSRLRLVLAASTSLQEIILLRLQDGADDLLLHFMRTHSTASFNWEPACTRAITSLSIALLNSTSKIRFTAPQISPEATLNLIHTPPEYFSAMGSHITSLDINIPSTTDLANTISSLSPLLLRFFIAAKSLTAFHIGFLGRHPLDLNLNPMLQHIHRKALRKLSIQGWRLDASELIAVARKHAQLRDLRLVGISLRTGLWRDVLLVLREELVLDHIELREIDYDNYFDSIVSTGMDVSNVGPVGVFGPGPSPLTVSAGTAEVGSAGVPALRGRRGLLRRDSVEKLRDLAVEDLGDDGVRVMRRQLPLWEAWVLSSMGRSGRNGRSWNM
ncbi:unnamed protein product [Penicillium salamii]|uniref:Uncharacterized protein n=1 Tax=Penicillium salamii TaxID=1612424 RepID=A0A9W4IBD0_9EURO|nr:unnamed protein product [Penicillium salamii]CAG7989444.1 unnamed protein product [Penicillium salamii]CAG7999822.1 unnamed protein product [Penicillium salamii]CAG8077648.1 unnamed protein product [Penicillium salamii]CAG8250398.1 unnamed protein product [Penicillium salamii]